MSIAIGPKTIIANGVVSPIRMATFPTMETIQPERVTDQPEIARSQVEILATNETNVFVTIPDIIIRNHHCHRWLSHNDWSWSCNDQWLKRHPSAWFNDTA